MNLEELAWLAGFFEGEGSVSLRYPNGRVTPSISIHIPQVELEPLEKALRVFGFGKIYGPYRRAANRSPIYQFTLQRPEHVQFFVACVWRHLCSKRREQASRVLMEWKDAHQARPSKIDRMRSFMRPLDNGCVEWVGWVNTKGAPMYRFSQRPRIEGPVRRYIYESLHGSLPPSAKIGTSCGTHRCVAEDHIYRKGNSANWEVTRG